MSERKIPLDWLERVLREPKRVEPDAEDAELQHRLGIIEEYGGRVLRVIIKKDTNPVMVITAYFDRAMRDRL